MAQRDIDQHLPLTEATFYILLTLVSANHGYAVMQQAEEISQGTVRLAPGTLYGAFTSLEKSQLISLVGTDGQRKIYQITELGKAVLREQIHRFQIMLESAVSSRDLWSAVVSEGEEL